ncbi:radical SAM family heme chaperone HemW [Desulfosarcina sp. OttesenSCG-928-G10]|nr:radical SAM family heme chaperone HemW [Desulfosarcina sp. OttesenSCG-928-G10]
MTDNASFPLFSESPSPFGGIYIHVPFCRAKCPYCDFYSITDTRRISRYVDMLITEVRQYPPFPYLFDTVYFGGGTPSLLIPDQVFRILEALHQRFCISSSAEITLEVNPGTTNLKHLFAYRKAGINRINIGLQSTHDPTLRFLGRIHTAEAGVSIVHSAQATGFENIGVDLIYGVPGQSQTLWQAELERVIRLSPAHLSCYTLTIEPGTPLAKKVENSACQPLDEALAGALFSFTATWLADQGYPQYEISNFARCHPGDGDWRSRHNQKYWRFCPYLGFGPAAHSFEKNRRWWNHRNLDAWEKAVAAGRSPVAESETLTPEQQLMEWIYLGLRQTCGIDVNATQQKFGIDFFACFGPVITDLEERGMMVSSPEQVRLTPKGMRFLETAAGMLIRQIPDQPGG